MGIHRSEDVFMRTRSFQLFKSCFLNWLSAVCGGVFWEKMIFTPPVVQFVVLVVRVLSLKQKTPENTETFSSQVETKRFRAKANPRVHENYS